jgi:hypothetical protein
MCEKGLINVTKARSNYGWTPDGLRVEYGEGYDLQAL